MRIMIDCRPLQYVWPGDERARLILSAARDLHAVYGVECIYIIDKSGPRVASDRDSTIRLSGLPGRAGWKLWYDWKLPRMARKLKADWIITTGGMTVAEKRIPQCCWMPAPSALKARGGKKAGPGGGAGLQKGLKGLSRLAEDRQDKVLRAARVILCSSLEQRDVLAGRVPGDAGKIHVRYIRPAAGPGLAALTQQEKEAAKERFAGGREYFFTDVTGVGEGELVELLKAFSRFKKRQQSNMQMVLAGAVAGPAVRVKEKLESYKYREDVHWYQEMPSGPGTGRGEGAAGGESGLEEGAAAALGMSGGAYAIVRPFDRQDPGLSVLEAFRMGVPVIATATGNVGSLAGDAVLYVEPGDAVSLAEKLMLIYKDEVRRSALLEKGYEQEKGGGAGGPAVEIWKLLQE